MTEYNQINLQDLDSTISDIRSKISHDPDPFLVEILKKLETVRNHQQSNLEKKAKRNKVLGGFKGFGIS